MKLTIEQIYQIIIDLEDLVNQHCSSADGNYDSKCISANADAIRTLEMLGLCKVKEKHGRCIHAKPVVKNIKKSFSIKNEDMEEWKKYRIIFIKKLREHDYDFESALAVYESFIGTEFYTGDPHNDAKSVL